MSSTTNGNHLRSERHDGVAVLILDNPAQRNAMSDQMTAAWVDAVEELAQDRSVRAVMCDRRGDRVLLRRQHQLDHQRAGGRGGLSAHQDDRVLPGLAFYPGARGPGDGRDAPAAERGEAGIAANAPIPTRYTKLALRDGGHGDFEGAVQWEALAQPITLATADLHEGIAAAREKRPPAFTGR